MRGQVFTFGVYPAMARLLRIEYKSAVCRIMSDGNARWDTSIIRCHRETHCQGEKDQE